MNKKDIIISSLLLYITYFFPEGEVWLGVGVSVVVWAIALWGLQWIWNQLVVSHGVHFHSSLLYGWGALLEQPPTDPSVNASGQVQKKCRSIADCTLFIFHCCH